MLTKSQGLLKGIDNRHNSQLMDNQSSPFNSMIIYNRLLIILQSCDWNQFLATSKTHIEYLMQSDFERVNDIRYLSKLVESFNGISENTTEANSFGKHNRTYNLVVSKEIPAEYALCIYLYENQFISIKFLSWLSIRQIGLCDNWIIGEIGSLCDSFISAIVDKNTSEIVSEAYFEFNSIMVWK